MLNVKLSYDLADLLIVIMRFIHGWRRDVKRTPPDLDLGLSVFGCSFSLVQPSQATIVALIEPPGSVYRQPHLVNAIQNKPQSANGSFQD